MCIYVQCVCMHFHVCACGYGGQKSVLGMVSSGASHLILSIIDSYWDLGLKMTLGWGSSFRSSPVWNYKCILSCWAFYVGVGA